MLLLLFTTSEATAWLNKWILFYEKKKLAPLQYSTPPYLLVLDLKAQFDRRCRHFQSWLEIPPPMPTHNMDIVSRCSTGDIDLVLDKHTVGINIKS